MARQKDSRKKAESRLIRIRKYLIPLAGMILIGVIGSGLWDALAKPGLTWFGRLSLDYMTLGLESIRDAAYSSAALTPTAIPSLVTYLAVETVLFGTILALYFVLLMRIRRYIARSQRAEKQADKSEAKDNRVDDKVTMETSTAKRHYWITVAFLVLICLTALASHTSFRVVNQSVLIWRVFNANIEIVSPHISDDQLKSLRARFSSMTKREHYVHIDSELRAIAAAKGLKLRPEELW